MKTIYVVTDYETTIIVGFSKDQDARKYAEETYRSDYPVYLNSMEVPDDFVITNTNDAMETGDLDFHLYPIDTYDMGYRMTVYKPGMFNSVTDTINKEDATVERAIASLDHGCNPSWQQGPDGTYLHYGHVDIEQWDLDEVTTLISVDARADGEDDDITYHVTHFEGGKAARHYVRD